MDRREFLTGTGKGIAFIAIAACLGGCKSESSNPVSPGATGIDFTVDLADSQYSALTTIGGSVKKNNIIIVAVEANNYKALSDTCTHEGGKLTYNPSMKQLVCPLHGSKFNVTTGSVTQGPAASGVRVYNVTQEGTILRIKG